MDIHEAPVISCFLLKVASRCNIDCDYCYMYNHLDQGWKLQPKLMSPTTLRASAMRIGDYVAERGLKRIAIVYHGGEPLLIGSQELAAHSTLLRQMLPASVSIDFSIQTNGVLLLEEDVAIFRESGIQVSLSLDGPASAQDRHRLDHKGKSTYQATEQALNLLEQNPDIFAGVIAVIDAQNDPGEILSFFAGRNIPQLDFLLPDANHITLPPGRTENPNMYVDWLIECFDAWWHQYPTLKIRTFDTILAGLLGSPSETDGLGFGDVSLITIETNGSYHDLDVLKITGAGTSLSKGSVHTSPLSQALSSELITQHRRLLKKEGLSAQCQACSVVEICGGGSVGHRFSVEGNYANPSVYCLELKGLIEFAESKVREQLAQELIRNDNTLQVLDDALISEYEGTTGLSGALSFVLSSFEESQKQKLEGVTRHIHAEKHQQCISALNHLPEDSFKRLAVQPSVVTWVDVVEKSFAGLAVNSIDGVAIEPDHSYVQKLLSLVNLTNAWPRVHRNDSWLRTPFGRKIYFEDADASDRGKRVLDDALSLIRGWKPNLLDEMRLISPEIQFIRDLSAHPDKIVSFSDNSVPGALYVQLVVGEKFVSPEDLADSLIHEHRHQRLYLLQRACAIVNSDFPLVASPWREELRPPTGLFHAIYVFVELLDFWASLKRASDGALRDKAENQCIRMKDQLISGFSVVRSCDLTENGLFLMDLLYSKYSALADEV